MTAHRWVPLGCSMRQRSPWRGWGERRQEREDQERGSVSLWLVSTAFIAIVLVGLGVDLGGRITALQHVRDVAAQAARAGGQQVAAPPVMDGHAFAADPAAAAGAARSYLAASDVTGTATVTGGGTQLAVTTEGWYEPIFLGVIGIGPMRVSGNANVRLVRVIDGSEH